MAQSRLGAAGLESYLFDVEGDWNTADRFAVPVRLLVAEDDLQDAIAILARALRGGFALEDGE